MEGQGDSVIGDGCTVVRVGGEGGGRQIELWSKDQLYLVEGGLGGDGYVGNGEGSGLLVLPDRKGVRVGGSGGYCVRNCDCATPVIVDEFGG